jgi:hypothetical protein
MKKKSDQILYFTKGAVPTEAEYAAAEQLTGKVVFRNAAFVSPDLSIERCDGVAGSVPEVYAKKYKRVDAEAQVEESTEESTEADDAQVETPEAPQTEETPAAPEAPVATPEVPTQPVADATVNGGDGWPQQ